MGCRSRRGFRHAFTLASNIRNFLGTLQPNLLVLCKVTELRGIVLIIGRFGRRQGNRITRPELALGTTLVLVSLNVPGLHNFSMRE